jgi:hypothetical protein
MFDAYISSSDNPATASRFFARSAFRSGSFIVMTALCFGCIVGELFLAVAFRRRMSEALLMMFVVVAAAVVGSWHRALRYHERISNLYAAGETSDAEVNSANPVLLEVAEQAILNLGVPLVAICGLLSSIGVLLSRG